MTDEDRKKMEELDDTLCNYCYSTDYGKTKEVHTPWGVSMCEGRFCEEAYEAWLESNEPEETDWRDDYAKWKAGQ